MKLSGARAAAFCARPDTGLTGALLYGPDSALIALRRRELIAALTEGDDLRLSRLEPAAAQRDLAGLDATIRARGFFPGRRAVLIEGARDGLAGPLTETLENVGPEDAFVVVTAEALGARSSLRRLFEDRRDLAALGLYPEPPDATELAALLGASGLPAGLSPEAMAALVAVAGQIDRGALAQLLEKIALNGLGRRGPLGLDALEALLPAAAESEVDRLVATVAEGRAAEVGPMIARLAGSGIGPVTILIGAGRHFRQLLALVSAPDGIESALKRLRPPAFGPRRAALISQARRWGPVRLETANRLLFQADRALRAPGDRPDRALVERCLIRLAMMAAR